MDPAVQRNLLKVLGLDRPPDHNLRKKKINMEELEMKALMYNATKKESLSSIADQLNATNRNHTLESSMQNGRNTSKEKQIERLF